MSQELKSEGSAKEMAYKAIKDYYNDYYTGAKIIKDSFDDGELKIELDDRNVTLSYDFKNKCVEEKDRIKRKRKDTEFQQMSLFDLVETPVENGYEKWVEGVVVKNICNNKEYKVKHDDGSIIEVFDDDYGYLIMARADLRVVYRF